MVRNDIISATKANNLYWLGRYEARVYMTLHLMNKCYDKMIDGHPEEYKDLWQKLDIAGTYSDNEDFTLGMLYDENNPGSVISAQRYAMDNAILLREDILSETLSYLEMSMAMLRRSKEAADTNITDLQPIIDWSLAFWGSAVQRVQNHRAMTLLIIGRNVENIDMLIRFNYPFRRIAFAYESLKHFTENTGEMTDINIMDQLDELLTIEKFDLTNDEYKYKIIKYINQLIRV